MKNVFLTLLTATFASTTHAAMSLRYECKLRQVDSPTYEVYISTVNKKVGVLEKKGSEIGSFHAELSVSGPILSVDFADEYGPQTLIIALDGSQLNRGAVKLVDADCIRK